MDAFSARDLEIDVDIQPGRDLGDILAVVVVVGDRRPPVAVDGEAREQRILFAQEGAALFVRAGGVLLAAQLERGARRLDRALGAVDIDLPLSLVAVFVLRVGSKKVVFFAVDFAAFDSPRPHFFLRSSFLPCARFRSGRR